MSLREQYDVLGLQPSATQAEIKARYRALARRWHPDSPGYGIDKQTAEREFRRINHAYSVVSARHRADAPSDYGAWAQDRSHYRESAAAHRRRSPFHGDSGLSRSGLFFLVTGLLAFGTALGAWPYFLAKREHMQLVRTGRHPVFVPRQDFERRVAPRGVDDGTSTDARRSGRTAPVSRSAQADRPA